MLTTALVTIMTPPVQSQGEDRVALSDGAMVYFRQRGAHAAMETDSVMVGVGSMGKKADAMRWDTDKQLSLSLPALRLADTGGGIPQRHYEGNAGEASCTGRQHGRYCLAVTDITGDVVSHCHQSFPISSVHMKPQPVTQSNSSPLHLANSPGHDAAEGLCTDAAGKGE